jgi:hypothetical protein
MKLRGTVAFLGLSIGGIIGLNAQAAACSVNMAPGYQPPRVEEIVSKRPIVFIGTVVSSGRPERKTTVGTPPREAMIGVPTEPIEIAKFRIEIPIRGVTEGVFEVRNGQNGMCSNEFNVGERWFFSGTKDGSSYFDGSTLLIDVWGNERRGGGVFGPSPDEIKSVYSKATDLAVPTLVVKDYLSSLSPDELKQQTAERDAANRKLAERDAMREAALQRTREAAEELEAASDYKMVEKIIKSTWQVFLSQHPAGCYADLAREHLAALDGPAAAAADAAQKSAGCDK